MSKSSMRYVAHEQKLDEAKGGSPNVDLPMEKTGSSDQKVVMGLAGQWRALENARFVPKQGDRRQLMYDIQSLADRDLGALYEWLMSVTISCRYVVPGKGTFRETKLKTIAVLRKMLDPDGVCGVNVAETVAYRSLAKHCSYLFANVGEPICQWTEGDDNPKPYFPAADVNQTIEEVDRKVGEDAKDDLNKCSDFSVAPSGNEVPGSKAFECLLPLSKHEIGKLKVDDENVVKCPLHGPERNLADCVYCHAGQQQLVEKADALCKQAEKKTDARSVSKVFCPLPFAKQIPMEIWKSKNAKASAEGWPVPKMVGLEGLRMEIPSPDTPLARWRINLRECLSYTILVTCPDIMSHHVNKDWTDTVH